MSIVNAPTITPLFSKESSTIFNAAFGFEGADGHNNDGAVGINDEGAVGTNKFRFNVVLPTT